MWALKRDPLQNRERDEAQALGGHQLSKKSTIKWRMVLGMGGAIEKIRKCHKTNGGGVFHVVWGGDINAPKLRKNKICC